jgi:hypothetical protein
MKPRLLTWLTCCLLLLGCEAPYVGEPAIEEEDANCVLKVTGFQIIPFDDGTSASLNPGTRSEQDITELCTRLTFVVYEGETKLRSVAQKQGDKDFGTAAFSLPQGKYTVAIIGYSGDGACTVSSLEKISFKDNRVTDTFLHCQELEVTDQKATHDVVLKRVVAKIRFTLTDDAFPEEVKQMKFYYTGGSSTLSALTSYGSVNSKQTVKLDVAAGQQQFEVYTIPHDETGTLKMTITALDASGNTIKERVFEGVPVRRNAITTYSGNFFDDVAESEDISFGLKADGAWEQGEEVAF